MVNLTKYSNLVVLPVLVVLVALRIDIGPWIVLLALAGPIINLGYEYLNWHQKRLESDLNKRVADLENVVSRMASQMYMGGQD